jgi:hypothetical protein
MNATGRWQRFKAAIQKTGVNFFVEVPARVSSSMRSFTHSGRIRVAGQLNQTPMQGTLIPVAGGRHRLFVNGGTRSAAKVGLGDVVSNGLRPTKPNEVVAPEDLTAGLHRVPGALDAFNAQPVSRRRELIRFVDDARTPQSRERRIAKTADHILGQRGAPRRATRRNPWASALDVPQVRQSVRQQERISLLPPMESRRSLQRQTCIRSRTIPTRSRIDRDLWTGQDGALPRPSRFYGPCTFRRGNAEARLPRNRFLASPPNRERAVSQGRNDIPERPHSRAADPPAGGAGFGSCRMDQRGLCRRLSATPTSERIDSLSARYALKS